MTEDKQHFVLRSDDARLSYPSVTLSERRAGTTATLGQLIESTAAQQLQLNLSCLGVLSFEASRGSYRFLALALLREPLADSALGDRGLRRMSPIEVRRSSFPLDQEPQLEAARQRCTAELGAGNLGPLVRRAFESSINFLSRHVSREDGHQGWSQYFDNRTVGSLSTAQGVLAHLHAGCHPALVEKAIPTLEAFQNPDGGWPVRRALVGEQPTQLSITESTCFCLWALREVGRTATDPVVERGLEWLQRTQQHDGSWRSSPRAGSSHTPATAAAVRVLAAFGRAEPMDRGARWIREAQRTDGGWGRSGGSDPPDRDPSTPAYTAHATIALLSARAAETDPAITEACGYLEDALDSSREEPWRSTSFNIPVDDRTAARLDFRHFASPWAIAALNLAGRDLSDPTVLTGTDGLLRLQEASGAWRSDLTAPGDHTVWALHDALFALASVLRSATRNLGPMAMARHYSEERRVLQRAVLRTIADQQVQDRHPAARRGWLQTVWLSVLTAGVALLAASQLGLLRASLSGSGIRKAAATVAAAGIAALGAIAPPIVAEEYKIWRSRRQGAAPRE